MQDMDRRYARTWLLLEVSVSRVLMNDAQMEGITATGVMGRTEWERLFTVHKNDVSLKRFCS
jgi:hypothetical protein